MLDSRYVNLGIAPIGWCNDDMPELGAENTFRQTVSEMALAGFTGCEIGNKYPTDPAELKRQLDLRGMRIASRWYSSFILTRPMEEEKQDFIRNLDFLEAVGASRINVSEQSYSIQGKTDVPILTGGHKHVMDDAEWDRFCKGLNRLGRIAADRGFKLCYHHHMGTVVQTSAETDRMMANTDPGYVFLCYDTGHFTFAGEDPLAMLKKYVDRVGHVHLKDMRLDVVAQVREQNWSFLQAVRAGAFTVPGDGNVNFDPVFQVLSDAGYRGWLLVEAEQDPAKADPLEYAIKARRYIREHTGL
ncbi:MAG: myo-inosose-2 dehydratase [Candidatus Faecousia sp.]|nr:myo-inosose-2 dehydratase [Candidatus Faecousia sp.]